MCVYMYSYSNILLYGSVGYFLFCYILSHRYAYITYMTMYIGYVYTCIYLMYEVGMCVGTVCVHRFWPMYIHR